MILSRTFIAGGSLMAMLVGLPMQASAADNYPQRPIKLIVPFPPGGGTDMFGRVVAEKLTAEFGWNVVVENKPGAGGSIGVAAAVMAAPRSEGRRVGKECDSPCRYRGSPTH